MYPSGGLWGTIVRYTLSFFGVCAPLKFLAQDLARILQNAFDVLGSRLSILIKRLLTDIKSIYVNQEPFYALSVRGF